MADNLFDVVNNKMFSVFNGKDRRTNYDLLSIIYDIFMTQERKQNLSRDVLIDDLTAYISGRNFDNFDDEDSNMISKNARDKASMKIRKFKQRGWLEEDTSNGFDIMVSLNDNEITILDVFRNIVDNKNHPLGYTGYFYSIYSLLKDFEYKEAKGRLEQIKKNTRELFNSLQGLNSSIKRFIEEMINEPNMKPDDVLEILLYKYQDQVMLTVFNNLKAKDNPSKYTTEILKKLNEIRYERLDDAITYYIDSIGCNITKEKYDEIESMVINDLEEVISKFDEVDSFIRIIDAKNSKFHNSAISTLNFLMNNKKDIEGKIIKALRELKDVDDKENMYNVFDLYTVGNIDEKSLYTRTFNKDKATVIKSTIPEVNDEEIDIEFENIMREDIFSKKKINDYVGLLLNKSNVINIKDIAINDFDDIIMLVMIQLYSQYDDMIYSINFLEQEDNKLGYGFKDFEIIRRNKE